MWNLLAYVVLHILVVYDFCKAYQSNFLQEDYTCSKMARAIVCYGNASTVSLLD